MLTGGNARLAKMKKQRVRHHILPAALLLFFMAWNNVNEANEVGDECRRNEDAWAYRGVPLPYQYYRDHHIIFNGEDAPVPAGTMVWISPNPDYRDDRGRRLNITRNMGLEGEHAGLFEVTYHSLYEYTANEFVGTQGDGRYHHSLAIWRKAREGEAEQGPSTMAGHVITAAADLEEGEYNFDLLIEFPHSGGCSRRDFKVIVDRDTTPPAPANVRILSKDLDGWTIGWDPTHGVDSYIVRVYRLVEGEQVRGFTGSPDGLSYRIRFADLSGCDDVVYLKVYPEGDGRIYLREHGEPSRPIEFRAEPCQPR